MSASVLPNCFHLLYLVDGCVNEHLAHLRARNIELKIDICPEIPRLLNGNNNHLREELTELLRIVSRLPAGARVKLAAGLDVNGSRGVGVKFTIAPYGRFPSHYRSAEDQEDSTDTVWKDLSAKSLVFALQNHFPRAKALLPRLAPAPAVSLGRAA